MNSLLDQPVNQCEKNRYPGTGVVIYPAVDPIVVSDNGGNFLVICSFFHPLLVFPKIIQVK
jgi:hypothetical protein